MNGRTDGWMCDMEEGQIPHGLTGFSVCLAFRAQAPSAPTSHQRMPSTKISHQIWRWNTGSDRRDINGT